jgi:hypothetical protein
MLHLRRKIDTREKTGGPLGAPPGALGWGVKMRGERWDDRAGRRNR